MGLPAQPLPDEFASEAQMIAPKANRGFCLGQDDRSFPRVLRVRRNFTLGR
jgi:hypothetical protein